MASIRKVTAWQDVETGDIALDPKELIRAQIERAFENDPELVTVEVKSPNGSKPAPATPTETPAKRTPAPRAARSTRKKGKTKAQEKTVVERILEAVAEGHRTNGDVCEATGLKSSQVTGTLSHLRKTGRIKGLSGDLQVIQ